MENVSSTQNDSSIQYNSLPSALTVAIPIVYGCICILGLLGNGVVIFVTIKRRSASSVPNVYVLNLAVADFLFMITLTLVAYQHAFHNWLFGPIVCKIAMSVDGLNQFTSVYTLTVMSIDRYLAIAHSLRSITFRTVHNARVICFFIWVFSAVFVLPLWMYGGITPSNGTYLCDQLWPDENFETVFILYTFSFGFALPLVIIIGSYACMLRYLVMTKRPSSTRSTSRNESKRVAVLVFAIIAAFVVCWLPFYVVHMIVVFLPGPSSVATAWVFVFSICLSYSNSCINPFIYTFIGRRFRMGFLPLPESECCRNRKGGDRRHRRVRRTLSGSSDTYGSRRSSNSQRVWSWRDRLTVVESVTYEETSVVGNHQDESTV